MTVTNRSSGASKNGTTRRPNGDGPDRFVVVRLLYYLGVFADVVAVRTKVKVNGAEENPRRDRFRTDSPLTFHGQESNAYGFIDNAIDREKSARTIRFHGYVSFRLPDM